MYKCSTDYVFYLKQMINTGKKRNRLRKKSHILVARYLADQMPVEESLQSHRKAFCLGSILPDIKPSFLTRKHEYFGTFEEIQQKMRQLVECRSGRVKERVYWRRLGEVMHYMADYFTFPHNINFTGNLYEHNKYEKHLKNHLKRYIESGAVKSMEVQPVCFGSFSELVEYIKGRHDRYLLKERNIAEDVQYILSICFQVIYGILHLVSWKSDEGEKIVFAA